MRLIEKSNDKNNDYSAKNIVKSGFVVLINYALIVHYCGLLVNIFVQKIFYVNVYRSDLREGGTD